MIMTLLIALVVIIGAILLVVAAGTVYVVRAFTGRW